MENACHDVVYIYNVGRQKVPQQLISVLGIHVRVTFRMDAGDMYGKFGGDHFPLPQAGASDIEEI